MTKTILDTNFLVLANKFRIELKGELEQLLGKTGLMVSSKTIGELKKIANSKTKNSTNARIALGLIGELRVQVVESSLHVDDWIAREAVEGVVVCTNDRKLIERAKAKGARAVCLKGRQKIGFC